MPQPTEEGGLKYFNIFFLIILKFFENLPISIIEPENVESPPNLEVRGGGMS